MTKQEIPYGYCQCGCGGKTNIASKTNTRDGWIKGEPIRFIKGHQSKRENSYNWNGGRYVNDQGYILILKPDHPKADSKGYIREHIVIA